MTTSIVSLSVDDKELIKSLNDINKNIVPKATARATNETLTFARGKAIKQTAKELKLPQKAVRKRLTILGEAKGDRARITKKATPSNIDAAITIWVRGIPVTTKGIAGKQTKRKNGGVKAKGGRFYKGAFYPSANRGPSRYSRMVFKRQDPNDRGSDLMVPKIGVRKRLKRNFDTYLISGTGQQEYLRRWNRLVNYQMRRYQ